MPRGNSAWIDHVRSVQLAQTLTWAEALRAASATYEKKKSKDTIIKKPARRRGAEARKSAAPRPGSRITSADTHRCVHLLTHPPKKGQSSTMQAYKKECVELLDRMCLDAATRDGLLDYDTRCAKRGAKLKVLDVYAGRVCCGEISKETMQQKSERLLRIAVKIVEVTMTPTEVQKVTALVEGIDNKSAPTWRSILRKLFSYVYSLLSFGIRRPVTLMIVTTAILLVGHGITSTIVADLTNSVGVWEVGKRMSGLAGRAAMLAAATELTRAQTRKYMMLIGAAVPVVKGAIGGLIGASALGALPMSIGGIAATVAVGAMIDAQTVGNVTSTVAAAAAPTAHVAGQAVTTTLRIVGEHLCKFVWYSASIGYDSNNFVELN